MHSAGTSYAVEHTGTLISKSMLLLMEVLRGIETDTSWLGEDNREGVFDGE